MTAAQPSFAFPGRWLRPKPRGTIVAPETLPDVEDMRDPETGPVELMPFPCADHLGARYWVGGELDAWSWEEDGMHVPDERALLVDIRALLEEMRDRGARVAWMPADGWGGTARGRRTPQSPLEDVMTEQPPGMRRWVRPIRPVLPS